MGFTPIAFVTLHLFHINHNVLVNNISIFHNEGKVVYERNNLS